MRRFFALAALIGMTWPHVVVMQCALMEPTSPAPHASLVAPEHSHASLDCPTLMACTSLMTEGAPAGAPTAPSAPPVTIGIAASVTPTGTVLTADPPPPRQRA